MMGTRADLKSGDEVDALTRSKRYYRWRPGVRAEIKRRFWKRARKEKRNVDDS